MNQEHNKISSSPEIKKNPGINPLEINTKKLEQENEIDPVAVESEPVIQETLRTPIIKDGKEVLVDQQEPMSDARDTETEDSSSMAEHLYKDNKLNTSADANQMVNALISGDYKP